jgi:hypothetical protein
MVGVDRVRCCSFRDDQTIDWLDCLERRQIVCRCICGLFMGEDDFLTISLQHHLRTYLLMRAGEYKERQRDGSEPLYQNRPKGILAAYLCS